MLYLVIFVFPILINSQVLDTDLSDGLNAEGVSIKYLEGSSEPFKGHVFNYYPNGNRELKGNYSRGLKKGKWVWWYPDGEKNKTRAFRIVFETVVDGRFHTESGTRTTTRALCLVLLNILLI